MVDHIGEQVRDIAGRAAARCDVPPGLHADVFAEGAGGVRAAREPEAMRQKYGMNRFGQSCLLARRLIEAGVRFVTVNMFETVFDEITWDIHGSKPFSPISCYRDLVGPMFDMAYSSLLEDLQRSRAAQQHHGAGDGRVRTDAEDQSGGRARPLAAVLEHADGGRRCQGRTGDRRVGRHWRRAQGPADQSRAKWRRPFIDGLGNIARVGIAGRTRATRFRWWIAGRSRSKNCSSRMATASIFIFRCLVPLLATATFAADLTILPGRRSIWTDRKPTQQLLGGSFGGWPSGGLDPRGAVDVVGSQRSPRWMPTGMVRPVADGTATITVTAQEPRPRRVTVHVKNAHAPFGWSSATTCIPVMTKMGCNSGRVPWRGGGQERIQADAARLRSGCGLRYSDAPIARPAGLAFRSVAQPDAAEADVRGSAWRWKALRYRFARISRDLGMDRGGRARGRPSRMRR